MKKIIAAVLAILAIPVIFAGCSGTSDGKVSDTAQRTLMDSDTTEDTSALTELPMTESTSATVPESSSEVTAEESGADQNLSEQLSDAASDIESRLEND